MEIESAELFADAYLFAKMAHESINQRRKYTGEPYIVHPDAVAQIVWSVPHTDAMVAAAFLHDVVEDTPVTLRAIEERFGAEIAELVDWLTDVSTLTDGNRATRKAIDLAHTARAPAAAKTIKLADLIDNTSTIKERDPEFWKVYRAEKAALLEVLREGDPTLWAKAASQIE